jgi:hypothetical protein
MTENPKPWPVNLGHKILMPEASQPLAGGDGMVSLGESCRHHRIEFSQ